MKRAYKTYIIINNLEYFKFLLAYLKAKYLHSVFSEHYIIFHNAIKTLKNVK